MKNGTSLYLDFLRVFSAFSVLLFHASIYFFSNNVFPLVNGHHFVIIFFALSGYVIAYSKYDKDNSIVIYFINRFSRLYSVIIPVLIITFVVDSIGMRLHPEIYHEHITPGYYLVRYIITFLNLQEIGGLSSRVSTNAPFWSLAYEFWYYILFGIYVYLKPSLLKYAAVLIILILFYKITILLPVWAGGVLAYKASQKYKLSIIVKIWGSLISFIVINLYLLNIVPLPFPEKYLFSPPLYYSADFLNDYFIGLITVINLFFISDISINMKSAFITKFSNVIRYLSSITFTLYLLHFPLLILFGSIVPYNKSDAVSVIILLILIASIIIIIGRIIENKRVYLKRYLEKKLTSSKVS